MKSLFSNERQKIFELQLDKPVDPFAVYRITLKYESNSNYTAAAFLSYMDNKLISQFACELIFKKGKHEINFNIIIDGYLTPSNTSVILLHINSKELSGFTLGRGLTDAILPTHEIGSSLEIFTDTIKINKVFDLRVHLAQKKYEMLNMKGDIDNTTPIILQGYYLREDGLGAHLPNLIENVFYNHKTISFNRQPNRHQLHFSFISNLKDFSKDELDLYERDFKWMRFYYSREGIFRVNPSQFQNAKFIHVGGFDLDATSIYSDLQTLKAMKKFINAETCMYLMWESTGVHKIKELINAFDKVVVTNTWLKDLIESELGHEKVFKVPHIAKYYEQPSEGSGDTFNFGYSGGLWERKGVDTIIHSFNKIKEDNDRLRLHSREFVNIPQMVEKMKNIIKRDHKGIDLKNRTLNNAEYASWWNTLNCYVFISSGEGFSMTPRQALLQGIPVILSKNTAHLDLKNVPGILWVTCEKQSGALFSGQPEANLDAGDQFIAKQSEVIEQMLNVKKNYDYWKSEAKKGGEIIRKQTAPDVIKKGWESILFEH